MLRKSGVLTFSAELAGQIDSRVDIPAGAVECEIRAAALVACEDIVAASAATPTPLNAVDLDYYLWALGKEGDYRSFERHATKDTSFY